MPEFNRSKHDIERGADYPYDAPDAWHKSDSREALPEVDWAHKAARGIIHNLSDRRDIKRGFYGVDEDVRKEIVECMAAIIKEANAEAPNA
jgi:hypothetical protein